MGNPLRLQFELQCPEDLKGFIERCLLKHPEAKECVLGLVEKNCNWAWDYCLMHEPDSRDLVLTLFVELVRRPFEIDEFIAIVSNCVKWDEVEELLREHSSLKAGEGICWNFTRFGEGKIVIVGENTPQCGVGAVRVMRDDVRNDDGRCKTCPYFVPIDEFREFIRLLLEGSFEAAYMETSARREFLYGR